MCHMSPVTCHVSPVTCHVSHVTCHESHAAFFSSNYLTAVFKTTFMRQENNGLRIACFDADICIKSKSQLYKPLIVRVTTSLGNSIEEQTRPQPQELGLGQGPERIIPLFDTVNNVTRPNISRLIDFRTQHISDTFQETLMAAPKRLPKVFFYCIRPVP